jgi:hypothetical protein
VGRDDVEVASDAGPHQVGVFVRPLAQERGEQGDLLVQQLRLGPVGPPRPLPPRQFWHPLGLLLLELRGLSRGAGCPQAGVDSLEAGQQRVLDQQVVQVGRGDDGQLDLDHVGDLSRLGDLARRLEGSGINLEVLPADAYPDTSLRDAVRDE